MLDLHVTGSQNVVVTGGVGTTLVVTATGCSSCSLDDEEPVDSSRTVRMFLSGVRAAPINFCEHGRVH